MDLQVERAVKEIKARGASLVGLQMPEGLKVKAIGMARQLEETTGCQVIILGDPCYGACDIRTTEGLDLLVHVGHAPIPDLPPKVPTVFLEVAIDFDVLASLEGSIDRIARRVGLVATAQHLHLLQPVIERLRSLGRTAIVGRGDGRTASPGQVLGCNVTAATSIAGEVDQFIFLGSGYFHPLAVSLGTSLPVLAVDPYRGMVNDIDEARDRVVRQRYAAIAKAREAREWLVILCDRPGQSRRALAMKCRDSLRENGRNADLLLLNEVRPDALLPYRAEAAVSTACPRLAIDDGPHYPIPLLTPWEMEMAIGVRDLSDYRLDQILAGDTPAYSLYNEAVR